MVKSETVSVDGDPSFQSHFPIGGVVKIEWRGEKYGSVIRGVFPSKCFLVDVPKKDGNPITFDSGAELRVHFIFSGLVYGMVVRELRRHPEIDLIVLEYPSKAARYNLREK